MDTSIHLDRAPRARDSILVVRSMQDVEPILEANKRERQVEQRHDCMRKIASIPNVVLLGWLYDEHKRGNTGLRLFSPEFNEIVGRKLRDPDWVALRTG